MAVAKKLKKGKHVPQRTCVGCRTAQAKRSLIRIVRTPEDGVQVDPKGKLHGRGAYLHDRRSCWELGLDTRLENALKTSLDQEDRDRLEAYMDTLPQEAKADDVANAS